MDSKRIVADSYDRLGLSFEAWEVSRPPEVREWFLSEVLARLGEGSVVLELGCGPGIAAAGLSVGRRYVGVDLSRVQRSIARQRVPHATFVVGDFTSMAFRPASFDGVVAFYVFMHVPQEELGTTFERIFAWLRPGGRLMLSLPTIEANERVEEWLGVPMYFTRFTPRAERAAAAPDRLPSGVVQGLRGAGGALRADRTSLGHREEARRLEAASEADTLPTFC